MVYYNSVAGGSSYSVQGGAGKGCSYLSSSYSSSVYNPLIVPKKAICCGRRHAGPRLQCGSCPLR